MKRIPVSQKMRKELEALLKGVNSKEFLLSEILKKRSCHYSSGVIRAACPAPLGGQDILISLLLSS